MNWTPIQNIDKEMLAIVERIRMYQKEAEQCDFVKDPLAWAVFNTWRDLDHNRFLQKRNRKSQERSNGIL